MKKTNLDRLLHRYITGQVTEQEKIRIEAWLDVKKTQEGKDMVLDEEDEEKLFRRITAKIGNAEDIKAFRPGRGSVRTLFSARWFQVAAALLVIIASSYVIWQMAARNAIHETITGADTEKVILDDGTIVWLRGDSRLTYDNRDGHLRQATLAGEGLFEVARDQSRPFTIACGGVTVKVVGTSFNLKARTGGVELKVLTGKVNVSSQRDSTGVDVTPREMVVYDPGGDISKIPLDHTELSAITGGTEYDMQFRNTRMESVIDRVEKKFDIEVVVSDPHVNTCRITADFTDHSLENTLDMMAELLEIEYAIKQSSVTITGKGCN